MINRRTLFAALVAFSALVANAQTSVKPNASVPAPVDVVKVMSFSCSFCLQAEGFDKAIESATRATGGRFLHAPIPTVEGDQGASERLYYASREMGPEFSDRVKTSLYKAFQSAEVPLFTFMQAYTWMMQDMASDDIKLNELFKKAQEKESLNSLVRAVTLSTNNGLQYTPTYILLVRNSVKAVLDTSSTGSAGLSGLRNLVINQIELVSKQNANATTP